MRTTIIIISKEQQDAFRYKESAYKSHVPYNYNSNMDNRCSTSYSTSSFGKIYGAVRDYYNTREWN